MAHRNVTGVLAAVLLIGDSILAGFQVEEVVAVPGRAGGGSGDGGEPAVDLDLVFKAARRVTTPALAALVWPPQGRPWHGQPCVVTTGGRRRGGDGDLICLHLRISGP